MQTIRQLLARCRFCGARQWRGVFTRGVCEDCRADTLAWFDECGAVVTWPIRVRP